LVLPTGSSSTAIVRQQSTQGSFELHPAGFGVAFWTTAVEVDLRHAADLNK